MKSKSFYVEIVSCSNNNYWYKDKIGQRYLVEESDGYETYRVIEDLQIDPNISFQIAKKDCKII